MRAIYHHKLNAHYSPEPNGDVLCFNWWMDDPLRPFAKGTERHSHGIVVLESLECTEAFYDKYVKTTPENVLHCRTCAKCGKCDIQRTDTEEFCNLWKSV